MTTVLVIDDEPPIRLLCRVNLEAEGMPVLEAGDGPSGLEAARSETPDVILLDVMMPGLDGWGVAEALLEDERTAEIPIIFLTARAEFRDRARGLDIGGVDYITKPFNPVELAPLVRGLLDRLERGERDELRREKLTELRGADGRDLAAGEVGGDDDGAGVAEEVAPERAEADPVPPRPEQVGAVARARHPAADDAAGGGIRPGAPGEVLAVHRAARARLEEPSEHVAVREDVRPDHRRGVRAGGAGEGGVDLERPEPVVAAHLVDDAEQSSARAGSAPSPWLQAEAAGGARAPRTKMRRLQRKLLSKPPTG